MVRRKSSQKEAGPNWALVAILAVAVAICGGCYLLTGFDPLGLFPDKPEPLTIGSGGDWWQVYFTNPQGGGTPDDLSGTIPGGLIARIDAAQGSIDVAAFEFDLTPVAEALIDAHRRGVQVRWVTDDEHGLEADEEQGHGQFARLERAGIPVRDDGRGALMHNKFWVFDSQIVWTGSTNVTANGGFRNNNNVIVIRSSRLAQIYTREFEEMWDGRFGPTSPSTADEQRLTLDGSSVQVWFAPEDEVAEKLISLIQDAQASLRFMAFSFTHDGIGEAVLARAQAGVDVKGIFETRGSETEYSELSRLYCAGLPVRQDGNPGSMHHKVLVIDEKIVVTGSFNFSDNADESNDENVVVVANSDVAAQYLQEFERRWAEASQPDAADLSCE